MSWMTLNKLNPRRVSKAAEVPYTTLASLMQGKTQNLGSVTEQKIADAYGLAIEDIFVSPKEPDFADEGDDSESQQRDVALIPEYDLRVSAGGGYFVDREIVKAHWPFPYGYLTQELRLNPGTLSIVEVFGDSMSPTLESGDRVMVDHGDCNPARPGIYAIWDSSATVVKRLEKIPASNPVELVLISDNKNHNQYKVLAENVNIIGRVVWYARRL